LRARSILIVILIAFAAASAIAALTTMRQVRLDASAALFRAPQRAFPGRAANGRSLVKRFFAGSMPSGLTRLRGRSPFGVAKARGMMRKHESRTSVPIESERRLELFVLTRFLHANRCPLRSKTL
jgi:hypothetical protein